MLRPFHALALILCAAVAHAAAPPQRTAKPPGGAPVPGGEVSRPAETPFRLLDNVEGDDVDLLSFPVKPMVIGAGVLWAVNTHGSEVAGFTDISGAPSKVFGVPWNPVSIEYWVSPVDGHHELLVVTRGTRGLTRLDPASGKPLGYVELPAEPGGSLRLGNQLFVACSAEDLVVQIDLVSGHVHDTFDVVTTRHLLFLSPDGLGNVLVTPLFSGNNTMPAQSKVAGVHQSDPAGTVLDMSDPAVATIGLPDQDVFRLIPGAKPGSGRVEVAARGVGTMLYAHGVNPVTGKLWVLNTESINAHPAWNSAPTVRGRFSENRLTLIDLPAPGAPPATQHTFVSLDDVPVQPIGKPYALQFTPNGYGLVAGTLTDNVSLLSPTGTELAHWDLPPGSLPRGVLYDASRSLAFTYCWGTNEIEVRSTNGGMPVVATLDVGYDPTSPERRAGRAIFYDARRSERRNAACESCHVEGMNDQLVWNISEMPFDDKGVMYTKPLKGIEFTGPYGWRGERSFEDFDADFPGLLGGPGLSAGELQGLKRFVFGLQNCANPFEHPRRVVTDDRERTKFWFSTHANLSATKGQDTYFTLPSFGTASCQECHTLPTGTDNDFLPAGLLDTGHRNVYTCTAYNGLWRKEQKSRATVQLVGQPPETRAPLGSGPSHPGIEAGVFEFNTDDGFTIPIEDREDIAFFMHQIDQGLAPAVHRATLVAPGSFGTSGVAPAFLVEQALARNCDLIAIGTVDLGTGVQRLRWAFDRASGLFLPEDADLASRDLAFFFQQARAGKGANLFVALPVGMGWRLGIDADADRLRQRDELQRGTNPRLPDTDGDGFLDGTEVARGSDPLDPGDRPSSSQVPLIQSVREMFHTARVAKLIVETNVPTHVQVSYGSNQGHLGFVQENLGWKTLHEVALLDLVPSNELTGLRCIYGGTITVTDEFGNQASKPMPFMETLPFIHALQTGVPKPVPIENVVSELALVSVEPAPVGYDLVFAATVEDRRFVSPAPLAGHVAIARVIVDGEVEQDLLVNGAPPATVIRTELSKNQLYGGFGGNGPFVVGSISGPDGRSFLRFHLPDASAGDAVQVALEVVGEPLDIASFDPSNPYFRRSSSFDLPNTPTAARVSEIVHLPSHRLRRMGDPP
jgi:hypothetical protein